jgi:hypothetical protein
MIKEMMTISNEKERKVLTDEQRMALEAAWRADQPANALSLREASDRDRRLVEWAYQAALAAREDTERPDETLREWTLTGTHDRGYPQPQTHGGHLKPGESVRVREVVRDPLTEEEAAQGRGEFRVADSVAQERGAERLKHERGSIRAAFDGLGLGWDYEDVWDYCNGTVSFRMLPRGQRGIVAGMLMGFAVVVVERVRDTER